ncbi:MAG: caspase family protein [Gammaproteobacteria bacterium]|nr:caspase family protein [Gammaproteobacteria bacterium]
MKRRRLQKIFFCGCFFLVTLAVQATTDPLLRIEAQAHTGPIRRLAVDRTGTRVVTVSDDKTARVWELPTRRLLSILRVPIAAGEVGKLYGAAISPKGNEVAIGGTTGSDALAHRIYLFDINTGAATGVIDARAGHVKHLAWTADGRYLVASYAGADGMRVFDRHGQQLYAETFGGASYGAAVSANDQIAVPAFDGKVRLYRIVGGVVKANGTLTTALPDPVSVSFSPDGKQLAVGYLSRQSERVVQVDVFELAAARLAQRFQISDMPNGNLMNVAWSADGSAIYAAGTGYRAVSQYVGKRIAWPSGKVTELDLATNSITDFAATTDGIVFSTFEPAWGLIKGERVLDKRRSPIFDLRGASAFKINSDGTQVSWLAKTSAAPIYFDVKQRTLNDDTPNDVHAAPTLSTRFYNATWENTYTPRLNGRDIKLQPGEVSRALAVLPDNSGALLASSWSLRKLDATGAEVWQRSLATEVTAVNVSDDSQLVVTASADGTIRWWRATDGELLLSLFVVDDRRWVLWTEAGHYDASIGAESLVGWHVNRPDGIGADFYSVARFRDRFYRPDVIRNVLPLRSAERALTLANNDLRKQAPLAKSQSQSQRIQALIDAKRLSAAELPPALTLVSPKLVRTDRATVTVDFSAFSRAAKPIGAVAVKVNGRPVDPLSVAPPRRADGKAVGRVSLSIPPRDSTVQLFVTNAFGVSEPLTVHYEWALPPEPVVKQPVLYVLAIGVSKYANAAYNLGFAAKDSVDFTQSLKLQEGLFYKNVVVRTLTSEQATRQAVIAGLAWLRNSVDPDDVGIVFMAGHGITDAGNIYYFLPHDADLTAPQATMVGEDDIREALIRIRGKALLFIDTCHAGKAVGLFTKHDVTMIANKLSSPESGVVVFSSSDGRQDSLEDDSWGNGAFTKELIVGLKGKADFRHEGVVTYKGLDYFVSHEVKKLTKGRQTPVTIVPVGLTDFPLVKTLE